MPQHNLLQSCREAITPAFNTVFTSDLDRVMHALILTDDQKVPAMEKQMQAAEHIYYQNKFP